MPASRISSGASARRSRSTGFSGAADISPSYELYLRFFGRHALRSSSAVIRQTTFSDTVVPSALETERARRTRSGHNCRGVSRICGCGGLRTCRALRALSPDSGGLPWPNRRLRADPLAYAPASGSPPGSSSPCRRASPGRRLGLFPEARPFLPVRRASARACRCRPRAPPSSAPAPRWSCPSFFSRHLGWRLLSQELPLPIVEGGALGPDAIGDGLGGFLSRDQADDGALPSPASKPRRVRFTFRLPGPGSSIHAAKSSLLGYPSALQVLARHLPCSKQ